MYSGMGIILRQVNKQKKECLYIISYKMGLKTIHEKPEAYAMDLHCVPIQAIESYATIS